MKRCAAAMILCLGLLPSFISFNRASWPHQRQFVHQLQIINTFRSSFIQVLFLFIKTPLSQSGAPGSFFDCHVYFHRER
jgi:hypothetical protein